MLNLAAQVGGHPLETTDRHRLSIYALPTARRFARPVTSAPKNCRENIRFAIEHVGIGIPALGYQPYIFGNVRVRGTGPLAVHDSMEIVRILGIGRSHTLWPQMWLPLGLFGMLSYTLRCNQLLRWAAAMMDDLLTEALCLLQSEFHVRRSLENAALLSRLDSVSNSGSPASKQ